jgi:hypothetical protein
MQVLKVLLFFVYAVFSIIASNEEVADSSFSQKVELFKDGAQLLQPMKLMWTPLQVTSAKGNIVEITKGEVASSRLLGILGPSGSGKIQVRHLWSQMQATLVYTCN